MTKDRMLKEIRRRVQTATDVWQRVKLRVLEKAIESGSEFDSVGQIVDESGDVFAYVYACHRADPECFRDLPAYIDVRRLTHGEADRFARFAEAANQRFQLNEHEEKAHLEFIGAYLSISC